LKLKKAGKSTRGPGPAEPQPKRYGYFTPKVAKSTRVKKLSRLNPSYYYASRFSRPAQIFREAAEFSREVDLTTKVTKDSDMILFYLRALL
jgi:hypothetical protein